MNFHFPWFNSCRSSESQSDPASSTRSWTGSFNFGGTPPSPSSSPPAYTRFDQTPSGYGYGYNWLSRIHSQRPHYWYGPIPAAPPTYFRESDGGFGLGATVGGGIGTNTDMNDHESTRDLMEPTKHFEIKLDISNYKPEEILVKTINNTEIIVEGHKNRQGTHTASSRFFERSYPLPANIPPENLQARITEDGRYLVLSAQRSAAVTRDAVHGDLNVCIQTSSPQK